MKDSFHIAVALVLKNYFWPGKASTRAFISMSILADIARPSVLEGLLQDFFADLLDVGAEDVLEFQLGGSLSDFIKPGAGYADPSLAKLDQLIKDHPTEALLSPVATIRTRARGIHPRQDWISLDNPQQEQT